MWGRWPGASLSSSELPSKQSLQATLGGLLLWGHWPGPLILCELRRLGAAHCLCTWDGGTAVGHVLGENPRPLGHSGRQCPSSLSPGLSLGSLG